MLGRGVKPRKALTTVIDESLRARSEQVKAQTTLSPVGNKRLRLFCFRKNERNSPSSRTTSNQKTVVDSMLGQRTPRREKTRWEPLKARGRTAIREAQVKRREARDLKTHKKAIEGETGGEPKHTQGYPPPHPQEKKRLSPQGPRNHVGSGPARTAGSNSRDCSSWLFTEPLQIQNMTLRTGARQRTWLHDHTQPFALAPLN